MLGKGLLTDHQSKFSTEKANEERAKRRAESRENDLESNGGASAMRRVVSDETSATVYYVKKVSVFVLEKKRLRPCVCAPPRETSIRKGREHSTLPTSCPYAGDNTQRCGEIAVRCHANRRPTVKFQLPITPGAHRACKMDFRACRVVKAILILSSRGGREDSL